MDRLKHRCSFWVDVATRGQTQPSLDHSPEIGDDIAEHVGRDHNIEPLRVFYKPHRNGIYEVEIRLDIGIFLRSFGKNVTPETVHIREDIHFVDRREFLFPQHGQVKGIGLDPA